MAHSKDKYVRTTYSFSLRVVTDPVPSAHHCFSCIGDDNNPQFVDKWGASATKASAAQSRAKQLRKMQEQGLLDEPALAVVAKRFRPSLSLPDPPRAVGEVLLSLKSGAQVGYVEGKPLVSDIDLDVVRGMRLLIRGPNGAGELWLHGMLCVR